MKRRTSKKDNILAEAKARLSALLGDRLRALVLFGSRAWGKPKRGSDYDLLVVVSQSYDWRLRDAVGDCMYDIDLLFGIITQPIVISEEEIAGTLRGAQPLIQKALKNGIYA